MAFLHGVEVVEIESGARPIRSIDTGVIGLVGTAFVGPVNAPTLISGSKREAATRFGAVAGRDAAYPTIPAALDAVFDQIGAPVVVVNCLDPANDRHVQAAAPQAQSAGAPLAIGRVARPDSIVVADTAAALDEATDYDIDLGTGILTRTGAAIADGDTILFRWTDAATGASNLRTYTWPAGGGADYNLPQGIQDVGAWKLTGLREADTDYTYDLATNTLGRPDGSGIAGASTQVAVAALVYRLAGVTGADVIGGVAADGSYTGAHALLAARERTGRSPRVLIAPRYSGAVQRAQAPPKAVTGAAVMAGLAALADRMRAVAVIDGPDTSDADVIAMRGQSGSRRIYLVDPWVRVGEQRVVEPASPRVAGVIARSDAERGYWWSPSNREIAGIVGTSRPVDFTLGDAASRANTLNAEAVTTIIRPDAGGFRLWGDRGLSQDPRWTYISVVRTSDAIQERLLRGHQWAVDRNLTATYVDEVLAGVSAFLRELQGAGAIVGGRAWVDPALNTAEQIGAGKVTFSLDFTPPSPAERVTIQAILTDEYLADVIV